MSQETGPDPTVTDPTVDKASPTRWIVIVLVVVAIILFISWARRDPPFDDRDPGPDDAVAAFVYTVDRGPNGADV